MLHLTSAAVDPHSVHTRVKGELDFLGLFWSMDVSSWRNAAASAGWSAWGAPQFQQEAGGKWWAVCWHDHSFLKQAYAAKARTSQMMLFSMLLAGVVAPNKCNSERLHVKPHTHQRAARNQGMMLQPLGQRWSCGWWARQKDKSMGFQGLSLPPSPPAAATHISLGILQRHFLLSGEVFTRLELVPGPHQPELVPSGQWESRLISSMQNESWMAGVPVTPNASGNAPSADQVVMHQCHKTHMSPYAMGQPQCRRTVQCHCGHGKDSSSSHPCWILANSCTPAVHRAQGLAYFHAIRKQEYG